jgi:hypothetical protein
MKIIALENTDYSIFSKRRIDVPEEDIENGTFIEIGNQNYFWLGQGSQCFFGNLANERNEFLISTGF